MADPLSIKAIDRELKILRERHEESVGNLKEMKRAGGVLNEFLARGFLTLYLLHLCSEEPRHGNDLLKCIDERTDGLWSPSSGGVYAQLKKMEKRGWLSGQWDAGKTRDRKIYSITDEGREVLDELLRTTASRVAAAIRVLEIISADLLEGRAPDK